MKLTGSSFHTPSIFSVFCVLVRLRALSNQTSIHIYYKQASTQPAALIFQCSPCLCCWFLINVCLMLWGSLWKASLTRTHAHKHHALTSYLLMKYGLAHGVVPLQRPCPICKTLPINIICTEREEEENRKLLLKGDFSLNFSSVAESFCFLALYPWKCTRCELPLDW